MFKAPQIWYCTATGFLLSSLKTASNTVPCKTVAEKPNIYLKNDVRATVLRVKVFFLNWSSSERFGFYYLVRFKATVFGSRVYEVVGGQKP